MDTSALGVKHTCPECDARFFDLNKTPVVCPKCAATIEVEKKPRVRRAVKKEAPLQAPLKKSTKNVVSGDDGVTKGDEVELVAAIEDDIDLDDDEDEDDGLMEDASDLGGEEDEDMSEIIEHIDSSDEK